MMVNYYEVDDKYGNDKLTGSTPLILFKREGEEEFLVFGCTESNNGRKVVEIDFTYTQTSMAPVKDALFSLPRKVHHQTKTEEDTTSKTPFKLKTTRQSNPSLTQKIPKCNSRIIIQY